MIVMFFTFIKIDCAGDPMMIRKKMTNDRTGMALTRPEIFAFKLHAE